MNIEEFEKSKKELLKAKEQNNKQISISDERTRMSKVNSFENKAIDGEYTYLLIENCIFSY